MIKPSFRLHKIRFVTAMLQQLRSVKDWKFSKPFRIVPVEPENLAVVLKWPRRKVVQTQIAHKRIEVVGDSLQLDAQDTASARGYLVCVIH
jgi:hypothetical protein